MKSHWWEELDWRKLVEAVVRQPMEDTPRLVAADWLDEWAQAHYDDTAAKRAAKIRSQINGGPGTQLPTYLSPNEYDTAGFPEHAYRGTQGLRIQRGWPSWAVFLPHEFTRNKVVPVFSIAPLTTISTVGMCAYQTHSRTNPFSPGSTTSTSTQTLFTFEPGPEDTQTGEIHDAARIMFHEGLAGQNFRRMARRGLNPHAESYRQAGLLPAPIFYHLPARGGAGGSVGHMEGRRREYTACEIAAASALKAAWLCAYRWSGSPKVHTNKGILRKTPQPIGEAGVLFRTETDFHYRDEQMAHGGTKTYPVQAPSSGVNAWQNMPTMSEDVLAQLFQERAERRGSYEPARQAFNKSKRPAAPNPLGNVSYCSKCSGSGIRFTKPRKKGGKSRRVRCSECNPFTG